MHTRIIPRWCIWLDNKKTQKTPPYQAPESRPCTQNIVLLVWVSLYKGKMISQPSKFHNGNHFITKNGVLLVGCSNSPYYSDVIMGAMASQITSLTIVYSNVYSGADEKKYQSSASPAFVRGIHWWPVKSPPKGPVTHKMFPFDDVIMFHQ